jgi:guanylate kinase
MIQNEGRLEWAEFCENYYGTPKFYVEQKINEGKDVILEIEVQGAQKIKELYPDAVFIFVVPPSLTELKHRLEGRGTEAQEVIEKRLKRAEEELELMREYNYVIVNESVEEAVSKINAIVDVEHCKAGRNLDLIEKIKKER